MRIGIGYDVHPFVLGRPLILGGVRFESDRGLAGHSDGDCLTHAVIDAILGAAGLGDIGVHFPPGDDRYLGASSLAMLREVVHKLSAAGWRVGNVDVTVVAHWPPIGDQAGEIRAQLASALRVDPSHVSVKATTTDGLGSLGRGEGLAAMAVALVNEHP